MNYQTYRQIFDGVDASSGSAISVAIGIVEQAVSPMDRLKAAKSLRDAVAAAVPAASDKGVEKTLAMSDLTPKPEIQQAWVNDVQYGRLLELVNTYAKKSKRLGLPAMSIKVDGERAMEVRMVQDHQDVMTMQRFPIGSNARGKLLCIERQRLVILSGEPPRMKGWSLMAKVEHEKEGNILKNVSGLEIPKRYLTSGSYCEHCNTNRGRASTYLVYNEKGEVKQIGGSCIKDFTGHQNAEAIAALAAYRSLFSSILISDGDEGDGYSGGGGGSTYMALEGFLSEIAAVVREFGYSKGDERTMSTVDIVLNSKLKDKPEPTPADEAQARAVIEWAKAITDDEAQKVEYLHNIRVLARMGAFAASGKRNQTRLAGSMIAAFLKIEDAKKKRSEDADRKPSEFMGKVGVRGTFEKMTVEAIIAREGDYGTTYIHKIRDADGNMFTWFASGKSLEKGVVYTMKGTVKAHDEYNGVKQTILSRVIATQTGGAVNAPMMRDEVLEIAAKARDESEFIRLIADRFDIYAMPEFSRIIGYADYDSNPDGLLEAAQAWWKSYGKPNFKG